MDGVGIGEEKPKAACGADPGTDGIVLAGPAGGERISVNDADSRK
jgi:hypothetical protein